MIAGMVLGLAGCGGSKGKTEQAEKGEARYFIPGYGWSENECFQKIDGDQNFYINDQDQLVIVFDEYEVAPGSMGMPEFVIDIEYEMN